MKARIAAYSFLLSGRWIAWFLLCCIGAALCLYLGGWQMSRAEAVNARNDLIVNNYDAAPLTGAGATNQFSDFDPNEQWRPVEMVGEYLPQETVLVRNRVHDGVIGYEVLVPFTASDGTTVVIDRGWIPTSEAGDGQPSEIPDPPSGEVTITARLQPSESDVGRQSPQGQIASINLQGMADQTDGDLTTSAYGQMITENPTPADVPEPFSQPDLDYGPNLSYALQWQAFSVLVFVAYGYSARQKVRNDQWDREYATQIEDELSRYYDSDGNFVPQGDGMTEEDVVRRLEMVDDMPAHLKDIMRPKRIKRTYAVVDAEEEDALLEAHHSRR
ncbi:SURF1 family cytochrome oxidase biogenesis protein [Kocuria sp.]|uniref:SURF1 family cytochrome oxidase biogenesis protein n=1 Tax=Kocuria sp. TaxID=1871328 RepID=UPI0026DFA8FB|nr:SURF1 family protein [Kocuria sp.]MDO5617778.1 SURF1 family protein [Kocuria sp.]